jgi:hypothetical protein
MEYEQKVIICFFKEGASSVDISSRLKTRFVDSAYSIGAQAQVKDAKIYIMKIRRDAPNRQSGHQSPRIFEEKTVYIGALAQ